MSSVKNEILKKVESAGNKSVNVKKLKRVLTEEGLLETVRLAKSSDNLTESFYWWINNLHDYPCTCRVCKKPITLFSGFKTGYTSITTCSNTCAQLDPHTRVKTKATCMKRYGVEHQMKSALIKQKVTDTMMERYGTISTLALPNTRETIKALYGNEDISKTEFWRQTTKRTSLERYGGSNVSNDSPINARARHTMSLELELPWPNERSFQQLAAWTNSKRCIINTAKTRGFQLSDINVQENTVNATHAECGTSQVFNIGYGLFRCLHCEPKNESRFENSVIQFLSDNGVTNIIRNDRKLIYPLELDIILPDFNLAIECNGDYWHSFDGPETTEQKRKHLSKLQATIKAGLSLIQISEHDWIHYRQKVESIILSRLGKLKRVYARETECRRISTGMAAKFFRDNHIAGVAPAKMALGLFNGEELISAISLGPLRFSKTDAWEIIRSAAKLNLVVVGGLSKLLKGVKAELMKLEIKELITYVDRQYFTGTSLVKLGWTELSQTEPGYVWFYKGRRLSRAKTQKSRLRKVLGEQFNEEMTEITNMFSNGASRLWNCGNFKYSTSIQ